MMMVATQMRKLRHGEVSELARSHTATKWHSWDLCPGVSNCGAHAANLSKCGNWGIRPFSP